MLCSKYINCTMCCSYVPMFLTSKLNNKLSNKLVSCYVWSIALYDSEPWILRKLDGSIWRASNVVSEETPENKMVR